MKWHSIVSSAAMAAVLLTSGCLGGRDIPVVDPVQETEFRRVVRLLKPLMQDENILDESGAWHKARISIGQGGTGGAGERLLNRLSPAFRFPNTDPAYLGQSFKEMLTEDAKIALEEHTVTMLQGMDRITLSLIASLDWDRNGVEDWLVVCRIEPVNSADRASREYYLLIPDPSASVYHPRILAIQDCRNGTCELFRSVGNNSVLVDFNTTDLMPGEHDVTVPPSPESSHAQSGSGAGPEERKLSE